MATEKQIRANRENAAKSTGPKSVAGKMRSSRNALRHGLAVPQDSSLIILDGHEHMRDEERAALVDIILASRQLERVSLVRTEMIKSIDLQKATLVQIKRLVALDRYDCRAYRLRRRAAAQLYEKS